MTTVSSGSVVELLVIGSSSKYFSFTTVGGKSKPTESGSTKSSIIKQCVVEKIEKGKFLSKPNQKCDSIWFIKKGAFRKYSFINGKETTHWINYENEMCTSLNSFLNDTIADEFIEAYEASEIIKINNTNTSKLSENLDLSEFCRLLLEDLLTCIESSSKILKASNAQEKYIYLHKIAPEMTKRANLGHIASILGITQETLSRIRSKNPFLT